MILWFKNRLIIIIFLFSIFDIQSTELDFRVAAFRPTSTFFRELYGSVQPAYQIEGSWDVHEHLQVWSNLSYSTSSGCSIPLAIQTRLHIIPISAGLKGVYHFQHVDIYAGAGICFTWLKETNHRNVSNTIHHVGGFFKQGIKFYYQCFIASIFIDYQIQKFNSDGHCKKIDTSGAFFGGGIGIAF